MKTQTRWVDSKMGGELAQRTMLLSLTGGQLPAVFLRGWYWGNNIFFRDQGSGTDHTHLQMALTEQTGYYPKERDLDRLEKSCGKFNPQKNEFVQEREKVTGNLTAMYDYLVR